MTDAGPRQAAGADLRSQASPDFRRNLWTFGVGTLGRDGVYTLVAFYLVVYLTDVLDVPSATMWWISAVMLIVRLGDAFLDPVIGALVDSSRSRWGQFKPWLAGGGVVSAVATVLLFTDFGLSGSAFVVAFGVILLVWGIAWSAHDLGYWGMLPALSLNPSERERLAATAKTFASVGQFAVVSGAPIVVAVLAGTEGGSPASWQLFAVIAVTVMVALMAVTFVGVRERRDIDLDGAHTDLRQLARVLFRNDQLLWAAAAYLLFMLGYGTTITFGWYFFKYAYGDENVFPVFALFVGLGQIAGLMTFPLVRKRWPRGRIYTWSTVIIVIAYAAFVAAPMKLAILGALAFVMFFLASWIMLLMLVFQADTIEYGQWKLGRRNNAVTFALQPFINKTSAAMNTWIISATIILAGINDADTAAEVTAGGIRLMKFSMLVLPAILIALAYLVWRARFRVDEAEHARIVAELAARGSFVEDSHWER
ncbi:MAG: glycoside-pentoside-hexuronide (GPH):cation symporter [Tetrasphaera sp.]